MKMTWIQSFLNAGMKLLPCTVLLSTVLASGAARAAEETFSINFYSEKGAVSGVAGLHAVEGWNNVAAGGSAPALLMSLDDAVKSVQIGFTYSANNGHQYEDGVQDQFLKGYLDDGGDQAQVFLTGIPFSQYSVIVYTATDTENRKFKPVLINGSYYAGSATETEKGYATLVEEANKDSATWGISRNATAVYGTNALRVDGLSGDLTIKGGSNGNNARGGIAAIQVINTGTLGAYTELVVGHTVMDYTYSLIFRGTEEEHEAEWGTVGNWYTLQTVNGVQNWTQRTGTVPGVPNSNCWEATLVDGALLDESITVGSDGYKAISVPELEGWESKIGAANGVHLVVENLIKVQAASDWRVDEASKITILKYGNGNNGGVHNIVCLAEEGILFTDKEGDKQECNVSFNYALGRKGSVIFDLGTGDLSGTQTIKSLELDLGDSSKTGIETVSRKLIGFTSSTATFSTAGVAITGVKDGTTAATIRSNEALVDVGDYKFVTKDDGFYVEYVAYGDVVYTEVTATLEGDATLSSLGLTDGATTIAVITVPDGATLTIDGTQTFAKLSVICEGSATIAGTTEALANIGVIDASGVTGVATYATESALQDVPNKFVGIDVIKKTGADEQTPESLAIVAGRQLVVANGALTINFAFQNVVATAEQPLLVTGANTVVTFSGNQVYNRMPDNGYIKAENGGTIVLTGVNLFNGDNGPRIQLDNGILKTTAIPDGHLKVKSVTMANGSKIQLSRAAASYGEGEPKEGLVLRSGADAKILVTAGTNTIEYRDDGPANDALFIQNGSGIEVAEGATLEVKVPVKTSGALVKSGAGTLIWNGSTTSAVTVAAGTVELPTEATLGTGAVTIETGASVVFTHAAAPTNAFSGAGTIVADGAIVDLSHATVSSPFTMRNGGTIILSKDQATALTETVTVPAGCTLKVKVADYNAVELSTLALADDTASVYFVLPSGKEVKGTVDGDKITMAEQTVYIYTATAGVENLWSDANKWTLNGATVDAAPTGTLTAPVEVVLRDATTLTVNVADVVVPGFSIAGGELTFAGDETLTVAMLSSTHKVVVGKTLIIDDTEGTAESPFEIANVIEVANGGTLITKGYLNCSAGNYVFSGGTLEVASGVTTFNTGDGRGFQDGCTVKVATGATLKNGKADAPGYGSVTFDIAGTLEVTNGVRWSLGATSSLTLHEGAVLKGTGANDGAHRYAFDWFDGNTITVDGNATIEGNIGAHNAQTKVLNFAVAAGKTLTISGIVKTGTLRASGLGTVELTGTNNTYTGGTTIDAGATIEATTIANFPATGSVVVNGRLRLVPGRNLNEETSTAYGTAEAPRLVGTGILEFAGNDGYYVIPAGFTTPLAVENNRTNGIVVSAAPGITIGTLSGTGYFRADLGDNAGASRVITVKQSKASSFTYVTTNNATTRAVTLLVTKAEGVADDVDTTLTLTGNTTAAGTTLSVAEGATVKLAGTWSQAINGAGTVQLPTKSVTNLSLSNFADTETTLEILEDETVTGYLDGNTWSILAKFVLNGTLTINNGSSGGQPSFKGGISGTGHLNFSDGEKSCGTWKIYGDMTNFSGRITMVAGTKSTAMRKLVFLSENSTTTSFDNRKITVADLYTLNVPAGAIYDAPVKVIGAIAGSGKITKLELEPSATLDVTKGALTVEELGSLPTSLTVKGNSIPTLASDRLTILKVKTVPADLAVETLTLYAADGTNAGIDFELTTGEVDAAGYTPIQLKAVGVATEYVVNTQEYSSFSAALFPGVDAEGNPIEGPFGSNPTSPMSLIIDFGDVDGEATPGQFDFDFSMEFVKVVIRGTNGGTVTKAAVDLNGNPVDITITNDVEVKEGVACTMDAILMDDTARITLNDAATALTLTHTAADKVTIGALISGAGQLGFEGAETAGAIELTAANTYEGGTNIAAGTTLEMGVAGALGTGPVSGEGTLVVEGVSPTGIAGLTENTWAGTLKIQNLTGSPNNGAAELNLDAYGSTASKIVLEAVVGWVADNTVVPNLILEGDGFALNNGSTNSAATVTINQLTGSGVFNGATGQTWKYRFLVNTLTDADGNAFTGSIDLTGEKSGQVGFVVGNDVAQNEVGKIVIDAEAAIANGATWRAGAIKVTANGTLGGTGTIGSDLIVASEATLVASATESLTLAAGADVTLPDTFNVVLPEGTALVPAVVILDRADTDAININGKAVVVTVGNTVLNDALLAVTADGDLAVTQPSTFVAEITDATTAWEDLVWTTLDGQSTTAPRSMDNVLLKVQVENAMITSNTTLTFGQIAVEGEAVALRFNRECVTQAMYEAIPTMVELVKTLNGLDNKVTVQLAPLKYGTLVTVTQDDTSATASLTLPDSAKTGEINLERSQIASISLALNGYQLADADVTGLAGYETIGTNWTRINGPASATSGTANLVLVSLAECDNAAATKTTEAGAVAYLVGNNFYRAPSAPIPLLKGYADDGGNNSLTIEIPKDKRTLAYTVVLYAAADSENRQFAHYTVNGTNYTAVDGKTQTGNATWGNSGPNQSSADTLAEGTNVLVIKNQTAPILTISENGPNGDARGGIAGVQIIFEVPKYNLGDNVTATVSAEEADTVVKWNELEWKNDDGNSVAQPNKTQPVTLIIDSDVTLDLTNAKAQQVQVLGYGHTVRFVADAMPETTPFLFSKDTIYRMAAATDGLPSQILQYPGTLRYEYAYDASTAAYATIPETTSEFTAGFAGSFTAAGGAITFSAGEVALSPIADSPNAIAGSSIATEINFVGTSRTTVTGEMRFGEATVTIADGALVTTSHIALSDSADNLTTNLVVANNARLSVTGNVNKHQETNGSQSSLVIAHWEGVANVTVRDAASLMAEQADMVLTVSGVATLTLEDEAEMRVRGLAVHAGRATCAATLNLNGGKLLIGETGIRGYATTDANYDYVADDMLSINANGGTFGALLGSVTLGADTASVVSTVTGTPIFDSATGATLVLAQAEPFLSATSSIETRNGTLKVSAATMNAVTVSGGTLTVAGDVTATDVTVKTDAKVTFEGGVLSTTNCTLESSATLEIPVTNRLSDGGYIQMDGALPDFSQIILSLVLNETRTDAEKVLPDVPVLLGTYEGYDNYDITGQPTVKGFGVVNNTNNAIATSTRELKQGDFGAGLYVTLTGNEVLKRHEQILTDKGYLLEQAVADAYPYLYFVGQGADARLKLPTAGVAVSHPTFSGDAITVEVSGEKMVTPVKANHISLVTDVTFDLSAWAEVLPEFVRGAVRGLPASFCLMSGGVTKADGVTLSVEMGAFTLPDGFEALVEVTQDGVYFVVSADRLTHTVSVNFTTKANPLSAPPAKMGAYEVPVAGWNDLQGNYTTTQLALTDLGGVPSRVATSVDGTTQTYLLAYNSKVNTLDEAPTSMLKVWLSDVAAQTVQLQHLPFEAYRVVLIFANDLEGAAYAPIQVNGACYTMDGEGYTRRDITSYVLKNGTVTSLEIPGDTAWGSTDLPDASAAVALGMNTLVTDVLTAEDVEIVLPAAEYGRTYAGLAALQIVEAPTTVIPAAQEFAYTFTTAGEFNLADLDLTTADGTATWESGLKNCLTLSSDYDVTVTLPIDFVADVITLVGAGKITLQVEQDAGAMFNTLDASTLTGDLTMLIDCTDVAFSAPAGVTTFEKGFNNNGQAYTIAAGATLVLGEDSGITTNLDNVTSPMLTLANSSAGTLRRNYPVRVNGTYSWEDITLAFKDGIRSQNPDNSSSHLLVEAGDVFRQTGRLHLATSKDWRYTQTGGSASFENDMAGEGGMLLFNNASAEGKTATVSVTGGRLYATKISAWKNNSIVNLTVSVTGTLALGSDGLRAQNAGARLNATFNNKGTLELAAAQLGVHNADRVSVTFNDGVITTGQATASLNLPVVFAATEEANPTVLAPAEGSTLVLNAVNTGSGFIEVTRGTVALAQAGALASTTTTVKAGATYEARGFAEDATMDNILKVEAGAILSATADDSVTTVRFAGTLELPTDASTVRYMLNGELYSGVTVDAANGTITFTTKATAEDVTWDAARTAGVWGNGLADAWVDDKVYYNGANVTFVDATSADVEVTIQGNVAPAGITWDDGSEDTYRFVAASEQSKLTLAGTELDLGAGQVYDVPVSTATNVVLDGAENTYRLIGALSNGNKTASLMNSTATNAWINSNTTNFATWCTDGATLAPRPGETQYVSAMGYVNIGDETFRSHMSGMSDVTITGGGTVVFAGGVVETGSVVAYQNKAFSGKIVIEDGSTLDIAMNRTRNDSRPWDDPSFFATTMGLNGNPLTAQNQTGAPLWTGDSVGVRVLNGSTFRVSGCRNIFGGWDNRNDRALIASRPLEIGLDATAEFSFADRMQVFPHGFRFTGDGATLLATQNMYLSGGTTLEVAGIGDAGDMSDPRVDKTVGAETYGQLTAGITATLASGATTGFVPWEQTVTANDPLELAVGEGSLLNVTANLLTYDTGDSLSQFTFEKTGPGVVRFLQPEVTATTVINLTEGAVGGSATFTAAGSVLNVAAGTTVEAGLSMPTIALANGANMAIDPAGEVLLHANRMTFISGGVYTIRSLVPETAIPEASTLPAFKVIAWGTARAAETATFVLDEALAAKGFGLEVRADGLYLMKQTTYVRELNVDSSTYTAAWYQTDSWYRLDDESKTLRDYDPAADETVAVLFLLPETYADETVAMPKITLRLNKAVTFSSVRFAVPVTVTTPEGDVTELKTVEVPVTYLYDLRNESMPAADRAERFTWVPTLLVMHKENRSGLASLRATVPDGYECVISDTTATVYQSATTPAVNINFTGGLLNDGAWVASTADPSGVVPFAGVYWNNASTESGTWIATEGDTTMMRIVANPAGIEPSADGVSTTCEVTYAFKQATTVRSRMTGQPNQTLVASYLAGNRTARLSETLLATGNMTTAGTQSGWQVRVASVPFETYDLYLVMAGATDNTVVYPALRIKVGEGAWRTYSIANDWAAPAAQNSTWTGVGSVVKNAFIDGQNVLHIRVKTTAGNAIEIAPWDNGQTSDAAAAAVGLAALQIVRCDDGAAMERVGDGKWSAPAGWRRTLASGTEVGAWEDATTEAPRYVDLPVVPNLEADMVATTPYLSVTGTGSMFIKGQEGVLTTGALDLSQMGSGSEVSFGADIFAKPINILLAPGMTVSVPEDASGEVVNTWNWLQDGTMNTPATIQKKLAGSVVFKQAVPHNLKIDDGTLWIAPDQNATLSSAVSGEGTFGKKGAGTLYFNGTMTQQNETPVHVSEGTLQINSILTSLGTGKTFLADGGTLFFNKGGDGDGGMAIQAGNTLRAENGGRIITGGSNRFTAALPKLVAENGTIEASITNGYTHIHCGAITLRDAGTLYINHNAANAWNSEGLVIHGNLTVEQGTGYLTVLNNNQNRNAFVLVDNAKIVVAEGATLNAYAPVRCRNTEKTLVKSGAGLWLQRAVMFNNQGGTSKGSPIIIEAGEWRYDVGGATHTIHYTDATTCPITIKAGAKLSGNVIFPEKAPLTFEDGAIVRSGVSGVATSALTMHTATFEEVTFKFDMRNDASLTITTSAVFNKDATVRLLNMGSSFTGKKCLMKWPVKPSHNFSSPEAMALDATLEKRDDGLYLVASNTSYAWTDASGNWSTENGWTSPDGVTSYPEISSVTAENTPVARLVASTQSVALGVDKGTAAADGAEWKAKSLILATEEGQTLALNQNATLAGDKYAGLNSVIVWNDIWKLGKGEATISAPVKFRNTGVNTTVNVAEGTLTLTHPLLTAAADAQTPKTTIPSVVEVASGATLVYDLAATQADRNTINGAYDPLVQTLTGKISGAGTLSIVGQDNVVTLDKTTTDNDLNLEVEAGQLILKGQAGAVRSTRRAITVKDGAILDLASENALGGSSNLDWTLTAAETNGAMVRTSEKARVRGVVTVVSADEIVATTATVGSGVGSIDAETRFNVPANTTLVLGGEWEAAEDAAATTMVTKAGVGVLVMENFAADVPVTVAAGELRLGSNAVRNIPDMCEATTPDWTVASGAMLTMGGGTFSLNGGALAIQSGAVLNGGAVATTVYASRTDNDATATITIADRAVVTFGNNSNAVGSIDFGSPVVVDGVVTINLDALNPVTLNKTAYTLLKFNNRLGSGTFQLGGQKLVQWAEHGWSLRVTMTGVVLQPFGNNDYYTWAGNAGGENNWAGTFWHKNGENDLIAWPTTAEHPSVMLQDRNPVTNDEIPEEARTLDWTMDAQVLGSFYTKNSDVNYTLTGSAFLEIAGDFLKAGKGKLTVNRGVTLNGDGALQLVGGETEFGGALSSEAGELTKSMTIAGTDTTIRFTGPTSRVLAGLIDGDGEGALIQSGPGTLSIENSVNALKAITVEQGHVRLLANDQTEVKPSLTVASGATLTYGGALKDATPVQLRLNADSVQSGTFVWNAETSSTSDKAPRLVAPADVTDAAIAVETFRYTPKNGHLILDPKANVMKPGFALAVEGQSTSALWLGARAAAGDTFTVSALTGSGVIGVEPTEDLLSDKAWTTHRVVTVDTAADLMNAQKAAFNGSFMGAQLTDSTEVRVGLSVQNTTKPDARTYFRYAGPSTDSHLGTLTIGAKAGAEITGTWAGDVEIAAEGALSGSGTVGAKNRTVRVPKSAILSGSVYGRRQLPTGLYSEELIPATLTVNGSLEIEAGSILNVLIRKDENEDTWASSVIADTLVLPAVLEDNAPEVEITVNVDLEEGAIAAGVKLLGWTNLSGGQHINGTVKVTQNGVPISGYILKQKEDGLYLQREGARFLMILQ